MACVVLIADVFFFFFVLLVSGLTIGSSFEVFDFDVVFFFFDLLTAESLAILCASESKQTCKLKSFAWIGFYPVLVNRTAMVCPTSFDRENQDRMKRSDGRWVVVVPRASVEGSHER